MFTASFYDSTGRIIGVMSGPRESVEATSEVTGDPFVEGASNPDLHYVRDLSLIHISIADSNGSRRWASPGTTPRPITT